MPVVGLLFVAIFVQHVGIRCMSKPIVVTQGICQLLKFIVCIRSSIIEKTYFTRNSEMKYELPQYDTNNL